MKSHHKACGSTKVERRFRRKKNKILDYLYCNHCQREVESYDVEKATPIVVRKVSFDDNVNKGLVRNAVIGKCFPHLVVN